MTTASLVLYFGLFFATLAAGLFGFLAARSVLDRGSFVALQTWILAARPFLKNFKSLDLYLAVPVGISLLISALIDYELGLCLFVLSGAIFYWIKKGPGLKRNYLLKRRENKMKELFPLTLGMAIQALKTGQTMPQVLDYLSKESPQPLKAEWDHVCLEMSLGLSAEEALSKMSDRFPGFLDFHQFLESYKMSRMTGANLTQLLEVLRDGMEEKNRLLRKMEAMTAQARLSGILMGALPFMLAVIFFCMDPDLMIPLFTERTGWAILGLAMLLETLGFLWIRQLLRLEV